MKGQAPPEFPAAVCPHLGPMLGSLAVAALLLGGVQAYVARQLPGRLPFYAAHAMSFKVNGIALQTAAFQTAHELPIYGSSEMDRWADNRPDAFFQHRPTGFAAFPVGRGGATCLMIQQKLAAVGEAARGKKVVIFLSPSWFVQPGITPDELAANVSRAQLSAWIFRSTLSPGLKADTSRRLQDFPGYLAQDLLISDALRSLAAPTPWNRVGSALLSPLGKLQNALLGRFDHGVILWEMIFPQKRWAEQPDGNACPAAGEPIHWEQRVAQAEAALRKREARPPAAPVPVPGAHDADFLARLETSREFADLTLLVRVLKELKMEALFIILPFNGTESDAAGVSPRARHVYDERMQTLLGASGYPWRDFWEHEEDRSFFNETDHPSAKAWIFYDREIDRFQSGTGG